MRTAKAVREKTVLEDEFSELMEATFRMEQELQMLGLDYSGEQEE